MLATREIAPHLARLFTQYPVVTITGPRQSGKTTLCRTAFPDLEYVNLERPDLREIAVTDPRGFLGRYSQGVILDEIQRAPELMSWIQVLVDERGRNGQFVLTGSEQFQISESISQSLAGRTAILKLLPLSIAEAGHLRQAMTIDDLLFTGFYPRIYDQDLDPTQALGDYFETYVERDVRRLSNIRDLSTFQRFVRLCAGRIGHLLNLHSLGNDAGVSHTTARQWIAILEASFVAFLLPPYHPNVSKRLIKTPKLYFHDVGLASYLLGIEKTSQIRSHPLRGALFENLVISEVVKFRTNSARRIQLHFYRDSSGHEIDLIYPMADRLVPIEVKSAETVAASFFKGLESFRALLPGIVTDEVLAYGGTDHFVRGTVTVLGAREIARHLSTIDHG